MSGKTRCPCERRLQSFHRREQMSIRMVVASMSHHSFDYLKSGVHATTQTALLFSLSDGVDDSWLASPLSLPRHVCASDRVCGTRTRDDRHREPPGTTCTASPDRIRGTCTCCHLCNTSSTDRMCDALTCDRAHRTSAISDLFYVESTVPSRQHHGSRHHLCQPWHLRFGEPAVSFHSCGSFSSTGRGFTLPWTSSPRPCTTKSVRNRLLPKRRPRK